MTISARTAAGGWHLPPRALTILIVAAASGLAGLVWSQRDAFTAAEQGALFEGPLDPADPQSDVTVLDMVARWRFAAESPDGPEIVADLEVPERRQTIRFSIRKNSDDQFPASHIIELVTEGTRFPGKRIALVPALFLKPDPSTRGRQLIGAPVNVADDRFWIALSSVGLDAAANLNLLRSGEVLDLALVYESGQRAALVFEKGETGRRAFAQGLAAWGED